MKTPTFKEQYDKIVGAYLRNRLNPFVCHSCFIGNLLNGNVDWVYVKIPLLQQPEKAILCILEEANNLYTFKDIIDLEEVFMAYFNLGESIEQREEALYRAMEHTLMELRKIHESKGEVIEDYSFTRRELTV